MLQVSKHVGIFRERAKYLKGRNLMHNRSRFLLLSVVEMTGRRLTGFSILISHSHFTAVISNGERNHIHCFSRFLLLSVVEMTELD